LLIKAGPVMQDVQEVLSITFANQPRRYESIQEFGEMGYNSPLWSATH
jgi:hypothetical protein